MVIKAMVDQMTVNILLSFLIMIKNKPNIPSVIAGMISSGNIFFIMSGLVHFIGGVHIMLKTNGNSQKDERKNPKVSTKIIYLTVFQPLFTNKRPGTMTKSAINVMICERAMQATSREFITNSQSNFSLSIPLYKVPRKRKTRLKLREKLNWPASVPKRFPPYIVKLFIYKKAIAPIEAISGYGDFRRNNFPNV